MNNEIQIFNSDEFGEIRTIVVGDEPWFVAADVCRALDISNPTVAISRLDDDERSKLNLGRQGETNVVNEPGLYGLVLGSRKPEARAFQRWIKHDVLPTIRKAGGYVANEDLFIDTYFGEADENTRNFVRGCLIAMRHQTNMINEQGERIGELECKVEQQRQTIEDYQPKVDYLDTILACPDAVTTTQIAADYDITAHKLNKILHEEGLQRKVGDQWILYRRHMGKGYTKSETHYISHNDGQRPKVVMQTKWTQKGRVAIYEIMKSRGIAPKMDLAE